MPEENVKTEVKTPSVNDQLKNLQNHCKQLEKLFYTTLNYFLTSNINQDLKNLKNYMENRKVGTPLEEEELKNTLDSLNMFELNEAFSNMHNHFKAQRQEFTNLINTFNTPVAVTPAVVETPKK